MKRGVWLVVLGIVAGCGPGPLRTPRLMAEGKGLVISNSPMGNEAREPRREKGRLSVEYTFLVENVGELTHTLRLGSAQTLVGQRSFPAHCRVAGAKLDELLVVPGSRYRVSCEIALDLGLVPLDRLGDQRVELDVPMLADRKPGRARFPYLFRAEDAS